jgi:hypothetical protein
MGGLSARPTAGRTDPAGTCWGQDPGSKMATVIPGPLRWCGPVRGGGGAGGAARACVCVWRPGVGPLGCQGGCHRVRGCAGVRVWLLARMVSDALLLEGRRAWATQGPFWGGGGQCPRPATPGFGRWPGSAGSLGNNSSGVCTTFVLGRGVYVCDLFVFCFLLLGVCVDMYMISFILYYISLDISVHMSSGTMHHLSCVM